MTKEEYISFELTCPPSLNWLFAGKGNRFKSKAYKNWLAISNIEFIKQDKGYKISGNEWLELHLNYFFPLFNKNWTKKVKDLDNYFKALIDMLTNNIDGLEDHKIKRIIAEKHDSENNTVKIMIKEIA